MDRTLLLNASYEPIRIISWEKAITLFFLGKVEVVDSYEREVRSVSLALKVPSIVRLVRFVHLGRQKPPLTKLNLLARDGFQCQYCSTSLNAKNSTVDHVIPRSQNGGTTWENVVIACPPCNRRKGGRTPEQANMHLKYQPFHPEWLPVFTLYSKSELPDAWALFLSRIL